MNNQQLSNKKRKYEEINIANILLELYDTHNYKLVTTLNYHEIINKLKNFKIKYGFTLGCCTHEKKLILLKITTAEIQIIKVIIDFNNIFLVPYTFTESTYQVIKYLHNEFNVSTNYDDLELCINSLYLKNIFELLKSDPRGKNINFSTMIVLFKKHKIMSDSTIDVDFDLIS